MISYIRGELVDIQEDKIIVDVGGVGYGIYMPRQAITRLPAAGREVKIHTYLNVREDAMQLFGFLSKDDLEVFKLVIGVSGIGPKGGLSILSGMSPDELRFAVISNDTKAISKTPGRCTGARKRFFGIFPRNERKRRSSSGSCAGVGSAWIWQYRGAARG